MNNTLYNINNVNIDSYDCLKPSTLNKAMILKSISFINIEIKNEIQEIIKKKLACIQFHMPVPNIAILWINVSFALLQKYSKTEYNLGVALIKVKFPIANIDTVTEFA
ncbi:MAG: hypothetical protein BWX49_00914 [Bacteroidetes bacterium ADurb.Bin008]|nr:MAG: hypothetical protein BWX49_00914 [Bacteroidetes bacterium ADurb.Bin008]